MTTAFRLARDDEIDGSPQRGHVAKFREHTGSFRCIKTGCSSMVDGCALFCALHLWTFDHPVLRDADIFEHEARIKGPHTCSIALRTGLWDLNPDDTSIVQ